jgi:cytidylate kinase
MSVITIRGQLGSGAPEIGKQVAERLHIDYIDREIIADVAKRLKRSKEGIADKEMPPGTLLGRIAEALGRGFAMSGGSAGMYVGAYLPTWEMPLNDTRYLAGLESVIKELSKTNAVVIRGRGSQFILKDYPGTIHILVVAPLDLRVKRIVESSKLDEGNAKKEIERFDSSRREFTKRYFHAELEDPVYYDLVINTEHLIFGDAASIVIGALPFRDKTAGKRPKTGKR